MKVIEISKNIGLVFIAAFFLSSSPVSADKPSWVGDGRYEKHRHHEGRFDRDHRRAYDGYRSFHGGDRPSFNGDRYFIDRHRAFIHDFYLNEYRSGHCPPGLVKKHNGCVPSGLARKWAIGRPLPRDVYFTDLPPILAMSLGVPPPGYRYVRVASDILMIAIGTGMVIDAINDLGMR